MIKILSLLLLGSGWVGNWAQAAPLPLVQLTGLVGIVHDANCPGTVPVCPDDAPCPSPVCHPFSSIEIKLLARAGNSCPHAVPDFEIKVSQIGREQVLAILKKSTACDVSAGASDSNEQTVMLRTEAFKFDRPVRLLNPVIGIQAPLHP